MFFFVLLLLFLSLLYEKRISFDTVVGIFSPCGPLVSIFFSWYFVVERKNVYTQKIPRLPFEPVISVFAVFVSVLCVCVSHFFFFLFPPPPSPPIMYTWLMIMTYLYQ